MVPSEQKQRKMQKERLTNEFSEALKNFQVIQRTAAQKEKESVNRARANSGLGVSNLHSMLLATLILYSLLSLIGINWTHPGCVDRSAKSTIWSAAAAAIAASCNVADRGGGGRVGVA